MIRRFQCALLLSLTACSAAVTDSRSSSSNAPLNRAAEAYVKLVLALGQHDADYVDAYYGPPQWKQQAAARKLSPGEIRGSATTLIAELQRMPQSAEEMTELRRQYLIRQLEGMVARLDLLAGVRMSFDDESRAIYDAVAPTHDAAYFENLLKQLGRELPGEGSVASRYEKMRSKFVIPPDKLHRVFQAAIEGCKARTLEHIDLPEGESFTVEYVTGKSWSGYNWYQGNYKSLIQVNTDLPIYVDRAIDLACHEGYPGHHVYNVLLEKNLVRDRGWVEFSVYPLFSAQSLIAEGTADYGIEAAFPRKERVAFEKKVVFPLAGLDPKGAERYYRLLALASKLGYAGNEAARHYLNGTFMKKEAVDWLVRYALMSPARAEQRIKFFDQYRAYVINYNLGKDLVRAHIERQGGTEDNPARRWELFENLLSSPRLPSSLHAK